VAKISLGLLVEADKSAVRKTSPPIVEGKKRLKKSPPEKEITIRNQDKMMPISLNKIPQRKMHSIWVSKVKIAAMTRKKISLALIISHNFLRSKSACWNKKNNKATLITIRDRIENNLFDKKFSFFKNPNCKFCKYYSSKVY